MLGICWCSNVDVWALQVRTGYIITQFRIIRYLFGSMINSVLLCPKLNSKFFGQLAANLDCQLVRQPSSLGGSSLEKAFSYSTKLASSWNRPPSYIGLECNSDCSPLSSNWQVQRPRLFFFARALKLESLNLNPHSRVPPWDRWSLRK